MRVYNEERVHFKKNNQLSFPHPDKPNYIENKELHVYHTTRAWKTRRAKTSDVVTATDSPP